VLVGTDGVNRMSKSRGNYIGIAEPPENIYGKTMSIPDGLIVQYYELLTDISPEELANIKQQMESGANPMALKKRLAKTLVTQFYSENTAREAEAHFEKTVQNKELPDEIQEYKLNIEITISRLLVEAGLVSSRSEAMRLVSQGGVSIDGNKITDANQKVPKNVIIKAGKRRYLKTT
jgi:tyrosyl-tRNA synthetase